MRSRIHSCFLCCTLVVLPAALASAEVNLSLTNGGATSTSVTPGGTFPVSVKLFSSATRPVDQATAVDYFLKSSANSIFTISSRNSQTVGSAFPKVYAPDATVLSAPHNPGLNPINSNDLGGSVSNTDFPAFFGTFEVADYVISVAPNAPVGMYTLTTFSNPTTGYAGPKPNFFDTPFVSQASYLVTIAVPEPVIGCIVGLSFLAINLRRPRRNTAPRKMSFE